MITFVRSIARRSGNAFCISVSVALVIFLAMYVLPCTIPSDCVVTWSDFACRAALRSDDSSETYGSLEHVNGTAMTRSTDDDERERLITQLQSTNDKLVQNVVNNLII